MDRLINGQMDRPIDGQMGRWTARWTNGKMKNNRWIRGQQINGQIATWIDGWIDRYRKIDREINEIGQDKIRYDKIR